MVTREHVEGTYKQPKIQNWVKGLVVGLIVLIISGLGVREWNSSQVVGHPQYRFNMAVIVPDSGVTFISFDPTESSVLALPFPTDLAINGRSNGEYSISTLYKLGSYKGKGGMFARQKIQGFMRVPVPGYVVVGGEYKNVRRTFTKGMLTALIGKNETSLSRFDAAILLLRGSRYAWREVGEPELVRAAVIEKKEGGSIYHPERLQEYVGTRLFDWGIGETGVTVAIINASGENGLGSDLADFLSNLGLDVVMVRSVSGSEILDTSVWQIEDGDNVDEMTYIFENLFGFDKPKLEKVPGEFRSIVLVRVGKDAKELF